MAEPLVTVSGLNKIIKGQTIVHEVSFQVPAGSIVGLCGGNGAGKSTILRMVAGILQPTSGDIRVGGLRWKEDRKQFAGQIGYMPDDFQFPAGLTAEEILSFWASLRREPESRVREVLEMVGLDDKRHKRVNSFSKGMRQRVLFAQAMLSSPSLILMDEPTNGLDPYWMQEFVAILKSVKLEGQTVLFSTHQLDIAEELADEVIFLNNGRICGEGTVEYFRALYGPLPLHRAFQQSLGLGSWEERRDDEG
ncbi:ABC transporter ATP-binding protein [Paenibacillus senegalimassiliensis]|uniref:ABC transporter ATP-binding protein n=1 Tax=Paenibacillus senegalimassiliensis TaxID=1737426 RepID=UPI00073E92DE|nr:ABC transporter ATP-binding protein [Paenibacillus senegalimassiliensis]